MGATQVPAQTTAELVLDAAAREFAQYGYEGATFGSVAKRAGVTKSLVSYYFPSKREMAGSVLDAAFPNGVFMASGPASESPLDDIVSSTARIAGALVDNTLARAAIVLQSERRLIESGAPVPYIGWIGRIETLLQAAISCGDLPVDVDTRVQAKLLVATFVGVLRLAQASGDYSELVALTVRATADRLTFLGAVGLADPAEASIRDRSTD